VRLVCSTEDETNSVYLMERMDKSLSLMLTDQSKDKQRSLIGRVDVLLQIAEGLNYLHGVCLVHPDLKTDNILISVMLQVLLNI
jgi:serine/threonine protein kinase